jgi:hypothetical protein
MHRLVAARAERVRPIALATLLAVVSSTVGCYGTDCNDYVECVDRCGGAVVTVIHCGYCPARTVEGRNCPAHGDDGGTDAGATMDAAR